MSQFDHGARPDDLDADFAAAPAAWPKVIGIFSLVWGILGVLCGACGAAATFGSQALMEWGAKMQAQSGGGGGGPQLPTTPLPAELKPGILQVVSAVGWPIGAAILIFAGAMLIGRKAQARTLHLLYAVVSGGLTLVGLAGAVMAVEKMTQFIAQNPDDPWGQFMQNQGGASSTLIQSIAISIFALAYPVFCIIWFGMIKRRPEDMGPHPEEPAA